MTSQIKNIAVKIKSHDSSWRRLLDSVGIPYINHENSPSNIDTPVLIVDQKILGEINADVNSTLSKGGSVIIESELYSRKNDKQTERKFFPYKLDSFAGVSQKKFDKILFVDIKKVQSGTIFKLPIQLKNVWNDYRIKKQFISLNNEDIPTLWENLTAITKKNVRRFLMEILKAAFYAAGLPFVYKWYWPNSYRSIFSFRADMDAGNEKSLLRFVDTMKPWSNSLSFFVCGQAYQEKQTVLKNIAALKSEIGNHTYTHYVYQKPEKNTANLKMAENMLLRLNIKPQGYVGPASFWHSSMYDVLEEKGYEYTSSFGIDHDNLPYFPSRNSGGAYDMVEIPFHCIGDRFPKFGLQLDSPKVMNFFDRLVEKKYLAGEPINIYGHPDMPGRMGDYPALVKMICSKALSHSDVWTGNMRELSMWWRNRHSTRATILFDMENRVLITKDIKGDPAVTWSIHQPDGRWHLVSSQALIQGVQLDALPGLTPLRNPDPSDIGEVSATTYKTDYRYIISAWRQSMRRRWKKEKELRLACKREKHNCL